MKRDPISHSELHALFKKRQQDQKRATTKRRRQLTTQPAVCGEILDDLFKQDAVTLRKMEEARALLAWERYVGAATHRHAKAERIHNGTITVRVSDPLWMGELVMLKNSLIERFRRDFPRLKIFDIFFTCSGF